MCSHLIFLVSSKNKRLLFLDESRSQGKESSSTKFCGGLLIMGVAERFRFFREA